MRVSCAAVIALALSCQVWVARAGVTIVSVTGPNPANAQDVRVDANSLVAVHWSSSSVYTNVTIAAQLYCTPCAKGDAAFADVYLMTQIGPLASPAQQVSVAHVKVGDAREFVTLFSGLTLLPGDYYLVIYSAATSQSGPLPPGAPGGPAVAWGGTSDAGAAVVVNPGTTRDPLLYYANNSAGPFVNSRFPPSSYFSTSPTTPNFDLEGAYNLQYRVTTTPAVVIPQVATGGGWTTSFALLNLEQSPLSYDLHFWDDAGKALQLPLLEGGAQLSGTLAPGAAYFAETSGDAPVLVEGWAEVVASGRMGVAAIVRRASGEAAMTGVTPVGSSWLIFDNTQGFVSTLALVNSNSTRALTVSLTAQLEDGTKAQGSVSVPPHGHVAFPLTSALPMLVGARGSLQLTASSPDLAVIGLRFSPSGTFTSLALFQ